MPDLPYEIVVPNPLPPHEPLVVAAAIDAETARVIAEALDRAGGLPIETHRRQLAKEKR